MPQARHLPFAQCNMVNTCPVGNAVLSVPQSTSPLQKSHMVPAHHCAPGACPRHGTCHKHNVIWLMNVKITTSPVGRDDPGAPHARHPPPAQSHMVDNNKILYCRGGRPRPPAAPQARSAFKPQPPTATPGASPRPTDHCRQTTSLPRVNPTACTRAVEVARPYKQTFFLSAYISAPQPYHFRASIPLPASGTSGTTFPTELQINHRAQTLPPHPRGPGACPRHGTCHLHNVIWLMNVKITTSPVGRDDPGAPHAWHPPPAQSHMLPPHPCAPGACPRHGTHHKYNPIWLMIIKILYRRGGRPRPPAAPQVRSAYKPYHISHPQQPRLGQSPRPTHHCAATTSLPAPPLPATHPLNSRAKYVILIS